jgi:hypothetical protein
MRSIKGQAAAFFQRKNLVIDQSRWSTNVLFESSGGKFNAASCHSFYFPLGFRNSMNLIDLWIVVTAKIIA